MASKSRPRRIARCGAIGPGALGFGVAAATIVWICAVIWQGQPPGDYTGVSRPVTASVDIISGLPSCDEIGPVGMIDHGTSLYFSDWCNSTTYKYDLDTAPGAREVDSSPNGLTGGLAFDRGGYYGIVGSGRSTVPSGIYLFDPGTLALKRLVAAAPCDGLTGLAADPATGDLLATSWCGLWRVSGVDRAVPVLRRLAAGEFDGIAVADGGRTVWVAGIAGKNLIEYSSTGTEITAVAIPGGPVGVALVAPTVRSPISGDLFTSNDDGSISMVDTRDGQKVSVVASGGERGEYLTIGPDGYLYVAKTDRIEQVQPAVFGPVTVRSRAGQGAPSAVALSAAVHESAFEAGLPLIVTFAAIAAILILIAGRAVYRRRRKPRTSSMPGPVAASLGTGGETAPGTAGAPPVPLSDPDSIRRRLLTDPHVLPSGTTLRLAVLVLMIIASTGTVYAHLSVLAHPGPNAAVRSCLAAAPVPGMTNSAQSVLAATTVVDCLHQYILPMAVWSLAGIAAVLVASAVLYALTPWWLIRFTRPWLPWPYRDEKSRRWKARRPWWVPGRRQGLQELRVYQQLGKQVDEAITGLARQVGLNEDPRVKVNPYSGHCDARAFGHQRRGYVRLDHGLLLQFRRNRRAFDAVVRHELAHLRNRDNRPTYLTYAAWRVFVALVLLPYAVSLIAPDAVGRPLDWRAYWFSTTTPDPHIAAAVLVMAALVYLTSRAVFRVRETQADAIAAAADGGALDEVFAEHQRLSEGKLTVPDWLSHHPGWTRRRKDLNDPTRLAAPESLAMLAAGVAISMIAVNVGFAVGVGSLASWLSWGTLISIMRATVAGDQGVVVWFSLATSGPETLIALVAIVGFATVTAWRTQLSGWPADNRASVLPTALPLVAGMMLGAPMSAIYANGGTWGLFDTSAPWDLADLGVSAAALAVIVVTVFRWAQESAAVWIPVTRTSLRRARGITAGMGMLGAGPALLVWILAHNTLEITSFSYQPAPATVSSWFGARWAFVDYNPLTYLTTVPGTAVLLVVPCLYLAAGAARRASTQLPAWLPPALRHDRGARPGQSPPRPPIKTALTVGLAAAVLTELAGFLLAIAARWVLGGTALQTAFYLGGNAAYLPVAWMTWTAAGACAVTSLVVFRRADRFALTSVLLTSFVCSSVAAVLLLAPLFVSYCGVRAFSCATLEPHDLLAAYGFMASEAPVYGAILAIVFLVIARLGTHSIVRFRAGGGPVDRVVSARPSRSSGQTYRHVILLLVLLNALGGVYIYVTQIFL